MTDSYIKCRVLRHGWDDISGTPQGRQNAAHSVLYGKRKVFRCIFCGTLRHEVWSTADGSLISRDYERPKDYRVPKATLAEHRLSYLKATRNPVKSTKTRKRA